MLHQRLMDEEFEEQRAKVSIAEFCTKLAQARCLPREDISLCKTCAPCSALLIWTLSQVGSSSFKLLQRHWKDQQGQARDLSEGRIKHRSD